MEERIGVPVEQDRRNIKMRGREREREREGERGGERGREREER